jgi:hypothetical protein
MKRKNFINLLFAQAMVVFILFVMRTAFDFNSFFYFLLPILVSIEVVHAFRRKHVTGKWFYNPFDMENVFKTIKRCFAEDEAYIAKK